MAYRDRSSLSVRKSLKTRIRRLVGPQFGLTQAAVMERLVARAEADLDKSRGMPPESTEAASATPVEGRKD